LKIIKNQDPIDLEITNKKIERWINKENQNHKIDQQIKGTSKDGTWINKDQKIKHHKLMTNKFMKSKVKYPNKLGENYPKIMCKIISTRQTNLKTLIKRMEIQPSFKIIQIKYPKRFRNKSKLPK